MQPVNNLRRQQSPGKMGIGLMNMLRFKRRNDVGNLNGRHCCHKFTGECFLQNGLAEAVVVMVVSQFATHLKQQRE